MPPVAAAVVLVGDMAHAVPKGKLPEAREEKLLVTCD